MPCDNRPGLQAEITAHAYAPVVFPRGEQAPTDPLPDCLRRRFRCPTHNAANHGGKPRFTTCHSCRTHSYRLRNCTRTRIAGGGLIFSESVDVLNMQEAERLCPSCEDEEIEKYWREFAVQRAGPLAGATNAAVQYATGRALPRCRCDDVINHPFYCHDCHTDFFDAMAQRSRANRDYLCNIEHGEGIRYSKRPRRNGARTTRDTPTRCRCGKVKHNTRSPKRFNWCVVCEEVGRDSFLLMPAVAAAAPVQRVPRRSARVQAMPKWRLGVELGYKA